jgi:hypothetical protein
MRLFDVAWMANLDAASAFTSIPDRWYAVQDESAAIRALVGGLKAGCIVVMVNIERCPECHMPRAHKLDCSRRRGAVVLDEGHDGPIFGPGGHLDRFAKRYGVSGGVLLTGEVIERLAREAEQGHDLRRLRARRKRTAT